jgi:hypothetical protein
MAAAAHDPTFAAKVGIPQGVAKEYNLADQAKKAAATVKILRGPRGPDKPREPKAY